MKILIQILFTGVLFCCGAFQGFDNRRICNPLQELNNIIQIEEYDCSQWNS